MFKGNLKPYQPEAVDKMVNRKKMLVAYEMGFDFQVVSRFLVKDSFYKFLD